MKLKQAKIVLEKINRLYQSMTLDEDGIDEFEKDLMLSYTRTLYAAFHTPGDPELERVPKPKTVVKKAAPKQNPPKAKAPVAPPVEKPAPAPVAAPVPVKTPEPEEEIIVEQPIVVAKPEEPVKVEKPVVKPKPKVAAVKGSQEQEVLFEQQEEATDLSSKLSQRPVKDLNKAMGINERILTINELFGGDQKLFAEAIKHLNTFKTFQEAKIFLTNGIAAQYNWASKEKSKKAKIFINLIRRRYS